jgi:hypothetical protein
VLLLAGLVAALLVYALLSGAGVVGALEEVFPNGEGGPTRITATFDEFASRELSELRTLLARTAVTTRERGASTSPATKTNEKPAGPGPSETDDGVLPPLPPPPKPPPLIPEVELPPVEVPRLLKLELPPLPPLEVPELPPLRELSQPPDLS